MDLAPLFQTFALQTVKGQCSVSSPALFLSVFTYRISAHLLVSSVFIPSLCGSGALRSAVGAVAKLPVLCDLQLGGVGGGDAVPRLHAVALLQL